MVRGFELKQLVYDMDILREQLQRLVGTKGLVDEEVLRISRELDERIVNYLKALKALNRL